MPENPVNVDEIFENGTEQDKQDLINSAGIERNKKEQELIVDTLEASKTASDKLWISLMLGAKRRNTAEYYYLSPREKYDLGYSMGVSDQEFRDEDLLPEQDFDRLVDREVGEAIIDPNDMNTFKNFFVMRGMFEAKAIHDMAKDRNAIRKDLSDDYTDEQKDFMADCLVRSTNNPNQQLANSAASSDMMVLLLPKTKDNRTYDDCLMAFIRQDLEEQLKKNPDMSVQEYFDLLETDQPNRERFLRKNKCKPEDKIYNIFEKPTKQAYGSRFTGTDEEKKAQLREATLRTMMDSYAPAKREQWRRQGHQMYRKGLKKSEQTEFDQGMNIVFAKRDYDKEQEKIQEIPGLQEMIRKTNHDNIVSSGKIYDRDLLSGKALNTQRRPGITEAFYNPDTMQLRVRTTRGAIAAMEATGTKWKYHSSDSSTYTKMMKSIRDYESALSSREGGKAREFRTEMFKRCMKYIKDKYSLRDSTNGQERFDSVMTLLSQEMKPEEFQKLLNKINNKRDEDHQLTPEYYQKKREAFGKTTDSLEMDAQERSGKNATMMSNEASVKLDTVTQNFGYDLTKEYPAIGVFGKMEGKQLTGKDYDALVFAGAINSKNSGNNHLLGDDIFNPAEQGVEDGKNATRIALENYSKGDPTHLASLLALGIRKVQSELLKSNNVVERQCLREMEGRMGNMLARDPELKKLAFRGGLSEKAYEQSREYSTQAERLEKIQRSASLSNIGVQI